MYTNSTLVATIIYTKQKFQKKAKRFYEIVLQIMPQVSKKVTWSDKIDLIAHQNLTNF